MDKSSGNGKLRPHTSRNQKSQGPAKSSPAPQGSPEDPYEVGYKKPPRNNRFKKGTSGNPKGRPKDSRNLASIMESLLEQPVAVVMDGIQKQVSGREAIAFRIFQKALGGDAKAIEILRETDRALAQRMADLQEAVVAEEIANETDQEILEHFLNAHKAKTEKSGK